jgi:hypothetical protein
MTDWTAGYVTDIGYTFGYYTELNPLRVKLAFLNVGLVCPSFGTACELGFGQGMSTNIHAAATVTEWHGTDFNPSQTAFAQEIAQVSGTGAKLYDESFAEFCAKDNLPDFDYIGLHGIWSWISDENREIIVDFVRRKLKVGGVLYISYNTMPGWASFAPIRHLMTLHADVIGTEGIGIINRVNGAIDFADKFLAINPLFAKANPGIANRVNKLKEQNRHYLAHEYFNQNWYPMHFATMAECLEPAKVQYACSANYLDHIDTINMTSEQQAFLNEIPDLMFRQSVRDFMVNQQFRRDYWVKGSRKISAFEQAEALREQKVILVTHRPDVSLKVNGALGEGSMNEQVYNPILDALADHKPKTIAKLEKEIKNKDIAFSQLFQSIMTLAGAGHVVAAQNDAEIVKAKKSTDKLNDHLIRKARGSNEINYLASPVTGGGIAVGRFQQLFLMMIKQGKSTPAEWAQGVWELFSAQGDSLLKDGKALATAEENLAELTGIAEIFEKKQLPILKALQIA